jgi:hypothetical protein
MAAVTERRQLIPQMPATALVNSPFFLHQNPDLQKLLIFDAAVAVVD